jgi:hypothetical protein
VMAYNEVTPTIQINLLLFGVLVLVLVFFLYSTHYSSTLIIESFSS